MVGVAQSSEPRKTADSRARGHAATPLEPRLLALYRAATPEQKLMVVMRLNHALQGLKEAQLVASRPDWTSEQRRVELRRWWFSARD